MASKLTVRQALVEVSRGCNSGNGNIEGNLDALIEATKLLLCIVTVLAEHHPKLLDEEV